MSRRLYAALLVVVVAIGGGWALLHEELSRLVAVNTLFDPDRIVGNFSNMDALFHSVPMPAPVHVPSPLPRAPVRTAMPAGFATWVATRNVTSVVILHRGAVAFEEYYLGTRPDDLRVSWSLGKSFLATLFGLSVTNGEIASVDDPVTYYAPDLIGSAYDGATIRNVLDMASGVDFDEDYGDFWSDINKMGRVIALGGSLDDFTAAIDARRADPGSAFHYVSMDTHALAMVLRGATGRRIPELMNDRLFAPMRLEADPYFLTDGAGNAFVLGGLNLTTRDYARFGQLVLDGGRVGGRVGGTQVVPEAWIDEMLAASGPQGRGSGYGYQWWIPRDARPGEVFARGVYGQYIWIDRSADVVIAITAADTGYGGRGVHRTNLEMMRSVVEELR
ncbi:MAG TPA: 6-aminohexanoate hydrolase [Rhodobacteraceae bacterium]|nr:6-aminohexanoate hydrolase [Paracoccaceae bacterium]